MSFAHSGYAENPTVKMYYSEYVKFREQRCLR